MISVGSKLSAATIVLVLIVTLGFYLHVSRYQRENLLEAKEMASAAVTRFFADSCAAPVVFNDDRGISDALGTLGRNGEIEYAAVWSVAAHRTIGSRLGELTGGNAEAAVPPPRSVPLAMVQERHPDRVVIYTPVRDQDGQPVAVAGLTFSLARENAAIADMQKRTLIVSAGVAMGLTVLLMAMAHLLIVRPLAKLVSAAKRLEEGGSVEVDVHSNDEIGELASAFGTMGTAIRIREERIGARNRDMRLVLDNVDQGFITLDIAGTMSDEHSLIVDEWFGPADPSMPFWDYLARVDAAKAAWFRAGWASLREDVLPLALSLDQLPRVVHKDDQTFELGYRPIVENERLDKTIVMITDVTTRIERERAEQAQREMMSIFHYVLSDRLALDEFFDEASTLVDAIEAFDGSDTTLLARQVHTLKGNCAVFGLESMAAYCHQLEDRMEQSAEPVGFKEKEALRNIWKKIADMRAQLARDGNNVELDLAEHDAILQQLEQGVDGALLVATFRSLRFEHAAKRLALLGEQIQHLANRMGKAHVDVVCEPTKLRLPPRKWGAFWSAFAHVIRNAVDHGIETTEERVLAGKPERATVILRIVHDEPNVTVTVHDDGRGIDWRKIAERAKARGLPHATAGDVQEALFADGISSRAEVTDTSGRGVGLAAVRAAVRQVGGHIEIESEPDRGTTLRIVLPESMLVDDVPRRAGAVSDIPRAMSAPAPSQDRVSDSR
jgi:HPt (histidine-containing phosphotransfer) domain-containing protein/HAMP domain-containing protein